MKKILIIGDVHLRSKKLKDISDSWEKTINYAFENDFDYILQSGDVFDHANVYGKEETTGTIYNSFLTPWKKSDKKIPILIISGNHDIAGPQDKDALSPIDYYSWITVQRKLGIFKLFDGVSICTIPWISQSLFFEKLSSKTNNKEEIKEKIQTELKKMSHGLSCKIKEEKQKNNIVIVLSHIEITGADMGNGTIQANGTFEISPDALRSLGADVYALGHLHKRQHIHGLPHKNDGYLGSICQLSFGEEGYECGARAIEIEDNEIVKDYWIPNDDSPKYFTTENISTISYRPGIDYVKIRSEIRPDDLPDGVIFEKKATRQEFRQNVTSDFLDADSPVDCLLKQWHKIKNIDLPIEDIIEVSKQIPKPLTCNSIGSLEKIERITLKNVTCHKDSSIDLDEASGIIAVEGPNGSGKTSAMESVLVALYGDSPSRSMQDMVSKNSDSHSVIELKFRSHGKQYEIKREFKNNKKTFYNKAYLLEDGKSIAGPNVSQVADHCSNIVGNKDLVLAGIFSSQGDIGNILVLKPAQRKELFSKLIGTDKFLEMSESAKLKYKSESVNISSKIEKILSLEKELLNSGKEKEILDNLNESKKSKEEIIKKEQEKLSDINDNILRIELNNTKNKEESKTINELSTKKDKIQQELSLLQGKKTNISGIDVKEIEEKLKEARLALSEIEKIQDEILNINQKYSDAISKSSNIRRNAEKIKTNRLLAIQELQKKSKEKETEIRKERNEKREEAEKKIESIKYSLATIRAKLLESQNKEKLLQGFPDAEACKLCPLAKDGIEARGNIESLKQEIELFENRINNGTNKLKLYNKQTDEMISECQVKNIDTFQTEELSNATKMEKEADSLEAYSKELSSKLGNLEKQIINLKTKTNDIRNLEAKISEFNLIDNEKIKLETQIDSTTTKLKETEDEINVRISKLTKEINIIPEKDKKTKQQSCVDLISKEIDQLSISIGRQEEKIETNNKKQLEIVSIKQETEQKEKEIKLYSSLMSAFGRDGIPQMLIEQTIPRFQDIMNELMEDLEGSWSIKVISQHMNKSGSIEEVIDIPVDDGLGERDIGTYSGGEKKLLKYVVRIAFSILQAERSGNGLKVLILDEAVDALDDDRATVFVSMINKLNKYFNQVFIISHNARILSSIQNKIFFNRLPGQSSTIKTMLIKT